MLFRSMQNNTFYAKEDFAEKQNNYKDKIPENFILWDFFEERHNYEEGNKEKTGRNETTCI